MFIFMLLLLLIVFLQMKPAPMGQFHRETYMSREQTTSINGIFVVLVLLTHASTFVKAGIHGAIDQPYLEMKAYLTQLIVVTFLFYSGYGMMESIRKQGMSYVYGIPWRRLFRIWYHFAIAVGLFVLTNIIIGNPLEPVKTLLAFTGWESIGNSNWYILAILIMYIAVFLSFLVARRFYLLGVFFVAAFAVGYIAWTIASGKREHYYNTILLFAFGMLYSLVKPYLDKFFMYNEIIYFGSLAAAISGFIFLGWIHHDHLWAHYCWAVLFMLIVLLVTMKFQIQNPILNWLGSHVFSIYILQRIPMMFLKAYGIGNNHPYLLIIMTTVITLFMAVLYDFLIGKLDGLIYRKRKQPKLDYKH